MKKKKFLTVNSSLLLVFLMFSSASADYSLLWTKQYGTSDTFKEEGNGVATNINGDIYVVGTTSGSLDGNVNLGGTDIFLSKFNSSGSKQWTKQYGSTGYDYGNSVAVDGSGNIFVTGSSGEGGRYVFLSKFSSDGTKLWDNQYGTGDHGYSVTTDEEGNVYITGMWSDSYVAEDIFLTKFDNDGTMLWNWEYGSQLYVGEQGNSVAVDGDGYVYITGQTRGDLDGNANSGGRDIFLSKFSSDGSKMWTEQYGSSHDDTAKSLAIDSSNNIYITGWTWGDLDGNINMGGNDDIFLTKFESNGNRVWTRSYSGTGTPQRGYSVAIDSNDDIYVTGLLSGLFEEYNSGKSDVFLTRFSGDGTRYWTQRYGSDAIDEGRSIAIDLSDNIYIGGVTFGAMEGNTNSGGGDIFLSKFISSPAINPAIIMYLLN